MVTKTKDIKITITSRSPSPLPSVLPSPNGSISEKHDSDISSLSLSPQSKLVQYCHGTSMEFAQLDGIPPTFQPSSSSSDAPTFTLSPNSEHAENENNSLSLHSSLPDQSQSVSSVIAIEPEAAPEQQEKPGLTVEPTLVISTPENVSTASQSISFPFTINQSSTNTTTETTTTATQPQPVCSNRPHYHPFPFVHEVDDHKQSTVSNPQQQRQLPSNNIHQQPANNNNENEMKISEQSDHILTTTQSTTQAIRPPQHIVHSANGANAVNQTHPTAPIPPLQPIPANENRPYYCPVDGCENDYTTLGGLQSHIGCKHIKPLSDPAQQQVPSWWWTQFKKDYCLDHNIVCAMNSYKHVSCHRLSQIAPIRNEQNEAALTSTNVFESQELADNDPNETDIIRFLPDIMEICFIKGGPITIESEMYYGI